MNRIVKIKALRPYVLQIALADGRCAQIDVEPKLFGEMFEPLRDYALFSQAKYDPELETVVWPNGADLSPETLAEAVAVAGQRW